MNPVIIIFIVIVLIILFFIVRYYYLKNSSLTSGVNDATIEQTIQATSLTQSTSGTATNYTFSIWIYITDWSVNYGQQKIILKRNASSSKNIGSPTIALDDTENNLLVFVACVDSASTSTIQPVKVKANPIQDIPIQKWLNILISVSNRTLDIYLDGKLVQTTLLPNIAYVDSTQSVYVTPNGGFSGYTSNLQYWPNATDPQTAWNIYAKGYSGTYSLFSNNYTVELSLYNNSQEVSSLTI